MTDKPVVAKAQLAAVWADCRKCGEGLPDPESGSHLLMVVELNPASELICPNCKTVHILPKWTFDRGRI